MEENAGDVLHRETMKLMGNPPPGVEYDYGQAVNVVMAKNPKLTEEYLSTEPGEHTENIYNAARAEKIGDTLHRETMKLMADPPPGVEYDYGQAVNVVMAKNPKLTEEYFLIGR